MPQIIYFPQDDATPLPRIKAMASFLFPYGKGGQERQRCFYQVFYWGSDVPDEIDGYPYTLEIFMVDDWDLVELKAALVTAVREKATELGLRVESLDVYVPSYETG